jgi:hypothetical protein
MKTLTCIHEKFVTNFPFSPEAQRIHKERLEGIQDARVRAQVEVAERKVELAIFSALKNTGESSISFSCWVYAQPLRSSPIGPGLCQHSPAQRHGHQSSRQTNQTDPTRAPSSSYHPAKDIVGPSRRCRHRGPVRDFAGHSSSQRFQGYPCTDTFLFWFIFYLF